MSRYAAIAGALVALAVTGGAVAAQEVLVPEGADCLVVFAAGG